MAQQFVLLPERGLRANPADTRVMNVLTSVGFARSTAASVPLRIPEVPGRLFRVVDSIREDGPKLVEVDAGAVDDVLAAPINLRLVPVREYRIATAPAFTPQPVPNNAALPVIRVTIVSAASGNPVPNAEVTAFTDFKNSIGAKAITDVTGIARLGLGASPAAVDRLCVAPPPAGFWGLCQSQTTIRDGQAFPLSGINLTQNDGVRHFYGASLPGDGKGVRVGIVDTGIASHPDLRIAGGRNTAAGEPAATFGDNGAGHGTHVAGIVAANGTAPHGLKGVAPEAELYSYRAYAQDQKTATNYAILKAMVLAVAQDSCDILNLSLGGMVQDDVIRDAIQDTSDQGTLVVAAAGNDARKAVCFPAAYPPAIAISAFGRKGTFPSGAFEELHIDLPPIGADPDDFMAAFTNIGREIFLTAPGVGIVSTMAGGGYGPMSGTSMACPVVAGMAARLLSRNRTVLSMTRDTFRTRAITNLLSGSQKSLGFPMPFQGFGRPV